DVSLSRRVVPRGAVVAGGVAVVAPWARAHRVRTPRARVARPRATGPVPRGRPLVRAPRAARRASRSGPRRVAAPARDDLGAGAGGGWSGDDRDDRPSGLARRAARGLPRAGRARPAPAAPRAVLRAPAAARALRGAHGAARAGRGVPVARACVHRGRRGRPRDLRRARPRGVADDAWLRLD